MSQIAGDALAVGSQPDLFETGAGLVEKRPLACDRAPETEAAPRVGAALDGERHIVECREAEEDIGDLVGTRHAGSDPPVHGQPGHVAPGEMHAAAVRLQGAGYMVDEGRLAGAVGSNQGMHFAGIDREIDPLQGVDRSEAARQVAHLEQGLSHRLSRAGPPRRAGRRRRWPAAAGRGQGASAR